MSSGTSILKSIIQSVNTRDSSRSGPWRTTVTAIGTTGGLKIIKRQIFIGYISRQFGLSSSIRATYFSNLNALVVGRVTGVDLGAILNVISMKQLPSYIFSIKSVDLPATVRGWRAEIEFNLPAAVRGWRVEIESNLSAILRGWGVEIEFNLPAAVRGWRVEIESNLSAILRGWRLGSGDDIGASLTSVEHQNIIGAARAHWVDNERNIRGIIRGWYDNWVDPMGGFLVAIIQPYVESNLSAFLDVTQPRNLQACLKVWPYKNLQADIYGWAVLDLLARMRIFTESISNLSADMFGCYPANLVSIIRSETSGHYNLNSYLRALQFPVDLSANMNYVYRVYSNLGAIIEILPMYLLDATIIGWAERNLSAYISTVMPPGYLRAIIIQHGTYRNLMSSVVGLLGVTGLKNLVSSLSGWAYLDIGASITTIDHISLMSSITSKGGTKDLSAYIKAKEIIFNELYKFSTINTADLRAYVGFSLCPLRTLRSAYASLIASILSVPIYDLGATIEGIKTIFSGFKDLGVFIRYTNKYSMMSGFLSFKHSMSVSEAIRINPAFFKDSLNITFKIINGQQDLRTYITSEPHNAFLGATIYSRLLIIHGSGTDKVLTEELVEIENYRRIWSEFIDVYLHSVKPIYYSDGEVFAQNYGDPIISFSFERVSSMGLNYSYNLTHDMFFNSTDAAIRYGFSKITGRTAFAILGATVSPIIKHLKLNAKIEGKEKISLYFDSPLTYLKSGTLSFMGTCVNNTLYKSKSNVFGGIQDIASSVSAVPN